jgi:hypothetical protein
MDSGETADAVGGLGVEDNGRDSDRASRFGLDRLRCMRGGRVGGEELREELLDRDELWLDGDGGMGSDRTVRFVGVDSASWFSSFS